MKKFNDIIDSHINGQFKQCVDQFTELDSDQQQEFYDHAQFVYDKEGLIKILRLVIKLKLNEGNNANTDYDYYY
tara:strand:- start:291 stop:512 length:222 start_codon:yes stop_codon:yes gene_type:complete